MTTPYQAAPGAIRVVHAVGWYFPESTGGTEVYVSGLASHLQARGVDVRVVAATPFHEPSDYDWNGVPVHRYPVPAPSTGQIRAMAPPARLDEFESWLATQQADIYHQHSWVHGCGLDHLRVARRLGLRTVLTVHVPGVVCLRGTMLLHGTTPCDGAIERGRCAECWGELRGVPALLRRWQGQHPDASDALARLVRVGAPARALATPGLVGRHAARLQEAFELSDRVVAVARWLRDALAANGAPASKLVYCPQGLAEPATAAPIRSRSTSGPLRVGYLGRLDPQKGVHLLIDAVRRLEKVPITLTIHGLSYDQHYQQQLVTRAGHDPRIAFAEPVSRTQLHATLSTFDLIAVPSIGFETGPLVALEALSAGTPVFGSPWGGIPELIAGVDGCRLVSCDASAWAAALADAANNRPSRVLAHTRTSSDIATDMCAVYEALMAGTSPSSSERVR